VALDCRGVHRAERAAQLEGLTLYVHVDLDVLDPGTYPSRFPGAIAPLLG
jgi:arginase family enzyme